VAELAARLSRVFDFSKSVVLRPAFPGCGYVDESEGDVILVQLYTRSKRLIAPSEAAT